VLWYASYGTNLDLARLTCYLAGGTPLGAALACPGARDASPPRDDRALTLPGSVYFSWESPSWGGGVAFYDPAPAAVEHDRAAARAYLLTTEQFCDVVAQEMHRPPGADLDLAELLATGTTAIGAGRYETLLTVDRIDGVPVVTFTSPASAHPPVLNAPADAYLATMGRGLVGGLGWDVPRAAAYLLGRPGVGAHRTLESLQALLG